MCEEQALLDSHPLGFHSHCQGDGDDGDGMGSRFWALWHSPLGEALFSAPQAKKNLGPKAVLLQFSVIFACLSDDRQVPNRGQLTTVLGTPDVVPCLALNICYQVLIICVISYI